MTRLPQVGAGAHTLTLARTSSGLLERRPIAHASALLIRESWIAGGEVVRGESLRRTSRLRKTGDIGRHNAVDKVIGRMVMQDALPLSDRLLCVSGRVSFEIVQKAVLAGIPIVAAVSAPSTARD